MASSSIKAERAFYAKERLDSLVGEFVEKVGVEPVTSTDGIRDPELRQVTFLESLGDFLDSVLTKFDPKRTPTVLGARPEPAVEEVKVVEPEAEGVVEDNEVVEPEPDAPAKPRSKGKANPTK